MRTNTPPRTFTYRRETYKGTELQQTPGIGPERFAAYALPRRPRGAHAELAG